MNQNISSLQGHNKLYVNLTKSPIFSIKSLTIMVHGSLQ